MGVSLAEDYIKRARDFGSLQPLRRDSSLMVWKRLFEKDFKSTKDRSPACSAKLIEL
jgi:hypothetical protein